MVLGGVEGHPLPNAVQDPEVPFFSLQGGLDPRRIGGFVLPLPAWVVSEKHREAASALATYAGLRAEAESSIPTVIGLVAVIFVFRWLFMTFVITPAGQQLLPPSNDHRRRSKTLARFESAGWEALWYTCSCSYGLWVYLQEDWSCWPTTNFWVGWPMQSFNPQFRFYYLVGLAFYTQALLSLLLLDKPRSDFWEYMIHHVVTIFLIGVSFYTRIQRYGLVILCLHDFGDVWLNWAKVFKYLGPGYDTLCTILFATFATVFFLTRLVFLPVTVIPSGYWEAMQIDPSVPGFTAMNIALLMLQGLHVFWFGLVLQAAKSFAAGGGKGSPDDIREKDS